MADIFGNSIVGTESWSAQGAVVTWNKGTNAASTAYNESYDGVAANSLIPILMQQIAITYQRTVQSFYPLNQIRGKVKKCNITGAPRGTLSVVGIYSPTNKNLDDFLAAVSKPCKTEDEQINIRIHPYGWGQCADKSGGTNEIQYSDQVFTLKGVELESMALQMQGGENAFAQMPLAFSFTALDYTVD